MGSTGGFDRVADGLGHRTRRYVLVELLDHNPVDVTDIPSPTDGTDDGHVRIAEVDGSDVSLVHVHLPKLEDLGYIHWNRADGTVEKGSNWDEIHTPLQLLHDHRDDLAVSWL